MIPFLHLSIPTPTLSTACGLRLLIQSLLVGGIGPSRQKLEVRNDKE